MKQKSTDRKIADEAWFLIEGWTGLSDVTEKPGNQKGRGKAP